MGPKIQAAIDFVHDSKRPGAWAAIGDLKDAAKIFDNGEGTLIKEDSFFVELLLCGVNR